MGWARVLGSMKHPISLATVLMVGRLSGARGACPVCGHDVARTQSFNGARMLEAYGCRRCGPTEYVVPVLA